MKILTIKSIRTNNPKAEAFFSKEISGNEKFFAKKLPDGVGFMSLDGSVFNMKSVKVEESDNSIKFEDENTYLYFAASNFNLMYETMFNTKLKVHTIKDAVSAYNQYAEQRVKNSMNLSENKKHVFTFASYEGYDKVPSWYKGSDVLYSEDYVYIKIYTTLFFDNLAEMQDYIVWLHRYTKEEYTHPEEYPDIIFTGMYEFNPSFIEEAAKYSEKIHSGLYACEFAFDLRKDLRKEARDVLTRNATSKRDKNMRLAYIRQFI